MERELKLVELQALNEAPKLGNTAMDNALLGVYEGRRKMREAMPKDSPDVRSRISKRSANRRGTIKASATGEFEKSIHDSIVLSDKVN